MTAPLRRLARLYGIQTAYYDFFRRRTDASGDAVLEVARQLGAPVRRLEDVSDAARVRTQEIAARVLDPVAVARPRQASSVDIRVPAARVPSRLACRLLLEDGSERKWVRDLRRAARAGETLVEGTRYITKRVPLPRDLPPGYHELTIDDGGEARRCRVIVAPMRAFSIEGQHWGVFLPLYSLHTGESWGAGDLSDLARLQDWVAQLGGSLVSILPILAVHHAQGIFDPSPYAPSSRLFWNEFYVDPRRAPELAECPEAQRLLASQPFQQDLAAVRVGRQIDYELQRALRRAVLEALARSLDGSRNDRYNQLQQYAGTHRSLMDYAGFAAVLDRRQAPWPEWPESLRGGALGPEDYDPAVFFYHLYVQWLAEHQVAGVSSKAAGKPGLYLDLPLGVHAHGYDPWRFRDVFALESGGGAPPDSVFTRGQNWAFPPLHPERVRARGYDYLIECLGHQLTHASSLRIDHVMALHRLYWIPNGWPASEGVYVQYRSEELYAILSLESHRHGATIVGENLGTVPASVNAGLARHGIRKMYVVQYEAQSDTTHPLKRVPSDWVASLNTHDMPPFAGYLRGMDLQDRLELGLLPKSQLRNEQKVRHMIRRGLARFFHRQGLLASAADHEDTLTRASLTWLARSAAKVVLINLEDLWLETAPQNLPGTGTERPNWRRRAQYALEEFATQPKVVGMLRLLADARMRGGKRS